MRASAAVIVAAVAMAACAKPDEEAATPPPPTDSLAVVDSFRTPESVLYDATMDVYVVSNINGTPFDADDNGFLSRVGTDGRVIELRWVDGASDSVTLNAPKGLAIAGDTLYVSDINVVRMFHRVTGQALGALAVGGAVFLNDVVIGPDGAVYVTDTALDQQFNAGAGGLYRLAGGRSTRIARLVGSGPNGLAADSAGVIVSFWNGDVSRFDARGRATPLPKAPGGLDGMTRLADGTLLVSAWSDSSVHRLASGDTAWTRATGGVNSPADFGYDTRRGRVVIPVFSENRIEIRPVR